MACAAAEGADRTAFVGWLGEFMRTPAVLQRGCVAARIYPAGNISSVTLCRIGQYRIYRDDASGGAPAPRDALGAPARVL